MEYVICCLCSLLCFACGVWAARGAPMRLHRSRKPEPYRMTAADDALSRDIAAMLAYTASGKEDGHEADS